MTTISGAAPALAERPNGSCTVTLAFVPEETPAPSRAEPRILIISGESSIRELLLLCLEPLGLELATARTLDEARTLIARGQFALVVLDWDGAEGVDLVHLSKTQHPDIPVIVCTGGDRPDGLLEGSLAREAEAVVNRRGSLGALAATIFRHLKPRETQPRNEAWAPKMYATGSAGAA